MNLRLRSHSLLILALALIALGCTQDDEPTTADESSSTVTTAEETTTTTEAPDIRGLGESLGLAPGQCYADVPETTTTTQPTTTTPPTSEGETTTTVPPETTEPPPITTTIPRPPLVAIVNCEGTNLGVVYETFCIGSVVDPLELVDRPEELGRVECNGDPELEWPGDRLLRRAAARECVARFEEVFDEPYALSDISTTEFVPSRGVWEQGDRRIVCTADQI